MRRAQTFLTSILTFAVIILFLSITASIISNGIPEEKNPRIGEKQEAVFSAVQRAHALDTYADIAAEKALREAEKTVTDEPVEDRALQRFAAMMRAHPAERVTAPFEAERSGDTVTFSTVRDVEIPVHLGVRYERRAALPGVLTHWPVDGEPVITSLFGWRVIDDGTPNTAGLDIRSPGQVAGPDVYAAASGTVRPLGEYSVELVLGDGLVCEYLHVEPAITGEVQVSAGEKIATVADQDEYAPHVDIRCYNPDALTASAAQQLWPDSTGTSHEEPADTTLAVTSGNKAYIDPYCLLSPQLRDTAAEYLATHPAHRDTISGFAKRDGNTVHEQLSSTCEEYAANDVLEQDDVDAAVVASAPYEKTVERLNQERSDGTTLMDTVQRAADQHEIDPALIVAMIAAESGGDIDAQSQTGVRGVMQVTCDTARRVLENGLSSCDDLRDPETSIRAGTALMKSLMDEYDGLTHQVAFMAAEYNGGGVVRELVEEAGPDPAYTDVMQRLTAQRLLAYAPSTYGTGYFAEPEHRREKVGEIKNHGRRVARYYEMGGGAAPPLSASSEKVGTYQFSLSATAQVSDAYERLTALRQDLSLCRTEGCVDTTLPPGWRLCAAYDEQLARTVTACSEQFSQGACSCRVPIPAPHQRVAQAVLEGYRATITTEDDDTSTRIIDWLDQGEDPAIIPGYTNGSVAASAALWTPNTGLTLSGSTNARIPGTGNVWARYDPATQLITLSTSRSQDACTPIAVRRYCTEDESLWVDHSQLDR